MVAEACDRPAVVRRAPKTDQHSWAVLPGASNDEGPVRELCGQHCAEGHRRIVAAYGDLTAVLPS